VWTQTRIAAAVFFGFFFASPPQHKKRLPRQNMRSWYTAIITSPRTARWVVCDLPFVGTACRSPQKQPTGTTARHAAYPKKTSMRTHAREALFQCAGARVLIGNNSQQMPRNRTSDMPHVAVAGSLLFNSLLLL
jgi:hypothetical protein